MQGYSAESLVDFDNDVQSSKGVVTEEVILKEVTDDDDDDDDGDDDGDLD